MRVLPWLLVVALAALCLYFASEASDWKRNTERVSAEQVEALEALESKNAQLEGKDAECEALADDYDRAMNVTRGIIKVFELCSEKGIRPPDDMSYFFPLANLSLLERIDRIGELVDFLRVHGIEPPHQLLTLRVHLN